MKENTHHWTYKYNERKHTSLMLGNVPTTRSVRVAAERRERCCECSRSIISIDLYTTRVRVTLSQAYEYLRPRLQHRLIDACYQVMYSYCNRWMRNRKSPAHSSPGGTKECGMGHNYCRYHQSSKTITLSCVRWKLSWECTPLHVLVDDPMFDAQFFEGFDCYSR